MARVKAIACELSCEQGIPLSRFSRAELHRLVVERGLCDTPAGLLARVADHILAPCARVNLNERLGLESRTLAPYAH